jgi:hypothetical protein
MKSLARGAGEVLAPQAGDEHQAVTIVEIQLFPRLPVPSTGNLGLQAGRLHAVEALKAAQRVPHAPAIFALPVRLAHI